MTYGEYYYRVKYDMKLINGNWISKPMKTKMPQRMQREEASIYYTQKFREYWKSSKVEKQ